MLPGQKAPFYLDFNPANSATGDQSWVPSVANVTVSVADAVDTTDTLYSGFTIPSGTVSAHLDSSGTYTVTGNVQNSGNQAVGNFWVVTTFYNASGTVIGLNYTNNLSTSLAPGNSVSFTATPADNTAQLSSEIANYSLLVQSLPATSSTTSTPTPIPSASSTQPSTSPTGTQPTQSKSTSLLSGTIDAIAAGVVVAVIVIIALLLLIRNRHKKAPVEPTPQPQA